MNILLSFLQDQTTSPHQIPAYRFWSYYIKNGIKEARMSFSEVPDVDWAKGLTYDKNSSELNLWMEYSWDKTIKFIISNKKTIDLFLCYLYPHQIDVTAINTIKQLGIPCVNFYCDNVRHFKKVPKEFKVFDLIWVPEFEAMPMYGKEKVKSVNLPMPMWVAPNLREPFIPEEKLSITFIGSKDILREQLFNEVINKGLDIQICGSGWLPDDVASSQVSTHLLSKILNQYNFTREHGLQEFYLKTRQNFRQKKHTSINIKLIYPKPDFDTYVVLTQNSSIALGVNRVPTYKRSHSNPLTYSRLRDIEAPMLGACYLTEYCAGTDHLYDTQNEIITYRTSDELVYKATELLADNWKRGELRKKGQKKALYEHSIPVSLSKIKKIIF